MTKQKTDDSGKFPVIKSARNRAANVNNIRNRLAEARKLVRCWHGRYGVIEASIEDILAKGGLCYGRNFVLPPCGAGVHDVAHPRYFGKDGHELSKEERAANKKKVGRKLGCNFNASLTAKAMMAAAFLKAGVRFRLRVGPYTIADTWPDYGDYRRALGENDCDYLAS